MIRKGEVWGHPVVLDGSEPFAADDRSLAALLAADEAPAIVVLRGGDLFHSLGGRVALEPTALPIDLLEVTVGEGDDAVVHRAVAHVIARRPLWRGEFAVGMNGTHLGDWNLGPKAHPNDGLVDVTRGSLNASDRLAARRRAPLGTHVPHPALTTSRVASDEWRFDAPLPIRVDGETVGRATVVGIRVLPDRGAVVLA